MCILLRKLDSSFQIRYDIVNQNLLAVYPDTGIRRMNMGHDVFISFSFQNQREAEKIAQRLKDRYGINCWICTKELCGGFHYKSWIQDAIKEARVVLLIQSLASIESDDVTKEISIAVHEKKTIIPFRIDRAELKGDLRYDLQGIDWIDGTVPDFNDRIEDLARAIHAAIGHAQTAPSRKKETGLKSTPISFSDIFYGRDALIRTIHETFQSGHDTIFLKGMAGIGKTELAKQYYKHYQSAYDTVIFARYESDLASVIADDDLVCISGLVRKMKADGKLQTNEEYAQEKLRCLSGIAASRTLFVIDNFDVMLDPWLDRLAACGFRLLITTRCDQDTKRYRVLNVGELSDPELRAFLIDCCKREYLHLEDSDPGFPALFAMTGRHTLTLELLAKYMCENSIDSVAELTAVMSQTGFALPDEVQIVHNNQYETVSSIIHNLFRMTALSDAETRFMHYLAMMPPSGIPQQYFRRWCGKIYSEARVHLLKLSLVKFDAGEKKLLLHPIIRQCLLSSFALNYDQCAPFINEIVRDLDENTAWNYPIAKKELLTRVCLSVMDRFPQIHPRNYDARYQMAVFLNFTDDYDRCLHRFEDLDAAAAVFFGEHSIQRGQALFRLGWLAANRMKPLAAQQYQTQALRILENYKESAASDYIHCLCDYSVSLYYMRGQASMAEESFHIVLKAYDFAQIAVRDNLCPDASVRKALAANCLVKYYLDSEQFDLAEEKITEAMTLYEDAGDCPLDLASILAKRGILYVRTDNPAAEEMLERAVTLFEQYGGRYSGTYFECLWMRIAHLERSGRMPEAIQCAEKTLNYARTVYEEDHKRIIMLKDKITSLTKKGELQTIG